MVQTLLADRCKLAIRREARPMTVYALGRNFLYPTPAVDHTGLDGVYKINLDFAPPVPDGKPIGDGPDLFSALESQLGLELGQRKEPVETIVIDHIQPPNPN
jgi:uncharacterized protein (TIGR03435 family)